MILRPSKHRYFYLLIILFLISIILTLNTIGKQSKIPIILATESDVDVNNIKIDLQEPASTDQYDSELDIDKFLNDVDRDVIPASTIEKLTDEEIREQIRLLELEKERKKSSKIEETKLRDEDPIKGTLMDNQDRRRTDDAPLPKNYIGSMTNKYAKFEQDRVVKEAFGNPDKQNATLFTLCRNTELYEILDSIEQLENRFNKNFNYDWVFINDEPFSEEFIEYTSNMVSGTARYGVIPYEHWSYPEYIDAEKAKKIRESKQWSHVTYGSSESYRHMCRYNSLFFYKHPIMLDYQYYWRVEPHVKFQCDIIEDPFKFMIKNKKSYGFTISMQELPNTIETLWSTSKLYFNREEIKLRLSKNNLLNFISDDNGESYNLCHFWSNFEIADLSFYRSTLYQEFVDHLDRAGGFFYERWGDAPIHSIAASYILEKNEFELFQNISYEHTVAGSCPLNDNFRKIGRCSCNPFEDWSISSGSSCNIKFLETSGEKKNNDFDKYYDATQARRVEAEQLKMKQKELRKETARRQSEARRSRIEARKKSKLQLQEKKKKKLESKQG